MNLHKVKRFISTIVVLALVVSVFPTAFAASEYSKYTDFPNGWSKAAMEHAVDNGLLSGRTSNTINPHDNLTRAEMATIINRVLGATVKADISNYKDVSPESWYYSEFAKSANMKNFIGTSDTTMHPDDNITREAVFTVMARTLVLETTDYSSLNAFPDSDKVSDWAKSAAAVFVSKGYIKGNDEGNICPKCNITREEFAQMMYNIVKTYYVESGTYSSTGADSSLIRETGVALKDVTIAGDLIIGDGVGKGTVNLENVVINGRLLCRGGEKAIKLEKTTVKEGVVVYDVNGTVHFDNYRTESVFKNIKMITPATFRRSGGGGGGGGKSPSYYTVSFHKGSEKTAFDSVQINQSLEDEERNLASLDVTLDGIYGATGSKTVNTYIRDDKKPEDGTANTSLIGNNDLDAEYSHEVSKEYIYEVSDGIWDVFTENTVVNKDIDVYYATKHMIVEATVPVLDEEYSVDLVYDSKSRLADSVKDSLIIVGNSLENARESVINPKITALYTRLNKETGMVDANGNILDKDYGLKIIDVIDYDQIQAEVKKYIDNMLNGSSEDLATVIGLFDIPALVDQIGGKELISFISTDKIKEVLKDEAFKPKAVGFIQDKIKNDPNVIISVLNNKTAKEALIENAAKNDAFIAKLLEKDAFKNEILNVIKKETIKKQLIEYLDKENVKNEILGIIKADTGFINSVTDADDATIRKMLVGAVAEPGKVYNDNDPDYETMSLNAKKVRDALVKIIKNNPDYASLAQEIEQRPYIYEAVIAKYATGRDDYFSSIFVPNRNLVIMDAVVIEIIEEYFANDTTNISAELKSIIDGAIVGVAKDYVNGKTIVEGNADSDKAIKEIIETNIISFIKAYFAGTSGLKTDADIKKFAEDIKKEFATKAKEVDISTIQEEIIEFVTDDENATEINTFVFDNYEQIVSAVDNELIENYITTLPDEEVNTLVKENATYITPEMIVSHIEELTPEERAELAKKIVKMLDSYKPYKDFMAAFSEKRATFEINKSNTHFVTAVGKAIYGFDFNEILEILKSKGFGPVIDLLGEEYVNEKLFAPSVKRYWEGLEPLVKQVEDSTDDNAKDYYTTKMTVEINIPSLLHTMYLKNAEDFKNKVKFDEIYDYNKNEALQKFANIDWFDLIIGYDESRKEENSGIKDATGYYIRDYMDYYCAMLDTLIIFDDALCFYNDKEVYDDATLVEVKKSLTKEVLNLLEKLQSLSDRIEQGKPIKGDFTLQDLIDKVDSVEAALDSFGGSSADAQADLLKPVIDNMKNILVNLGEGNLPNGYTLDDLTKISTKLKTVIEGMNEGEYKAVNADFKDIIKSSMEKLGDILTELDEKGTIGGNSIESMLSKLSVLNNIYNKYSEQIKNIISVLADADLGSIDVPFDSEKYEEIIFGRESEDDIFNIDSVVDVVKVKLGESETTGHNKEGAYVIDQYSKAVEGFSLFLQRKFY